MAILGKKPIPGLGDDLPIEDSDLGLPSSSGSFGLPGAVTPSFGSASASAAPATQFSAPQQDRGHGAAATAAGGADSLVAHSKESADWINTKWRPAMGWLYMVTCFVDFVIFPILWSVLQTVQGGQVTSQWNPLTLQGAGLYHIAMGAVLGIAAYGRTKEKLDSKQ
jgi:hypothetical protein